MARAHVDWMLTSEFTQQSFDASGAAVGVAPAGFAVDDSNVRHKLLTVCSAAYIRGVMADLELA